METGIQTHWLIDTYNRGNKKSEVKVSRKNPRFFNPKTVRRVDSLHQLLYLGRVFQVISQGAISSPMYSMKGPSMVQSLYPTAFPLKHQQKVQNLSTRFIYRGIHYISWQQIFIFAGPSTGSGVSWICFTTNSHCSGCKWTIQGGKIPWFE